nr:aldehyde dehydrogenase family protein [Piscinibacter sp.]
MVFDDADIDSAVEGAMVSGTATRARPASARIACTCRTRSDAFVAKLAEKAKGIKVGNGFEAGVNQGPLIDDQATAKVERHVADAVSKGAKVVVGGTKMGDRFYTPTVLADVTADMLCAKEETFGPVAPVFRFKTEEEVIAAANNTEFGLASYFYSRDVGRIFRVSEALEYGMVGINTGLISTAEVPFGGVKQSGLGREGSHHGIDDYVEIKYLCLGDILK